MAMTSMANATMDGMRRKPNFSLDEKLFLINYIKEHKSLHEQIDPYVGDLTKSLNGWSEIATAFEKHFPGKTSRDPNDLRSCWKRIRDKARCIYAPNSTPLAPYKQLTKPKWLEKKKPVPNIVSKLAWEFMVQQECNSQGPQYMDESREWSQHSEQSYEQQMLQSAESPELLLLEPDDSDDDEIVETDSNDVIRIKKEWIEDDAETIEASDKDLQEFSENVGHLPADSKSSAPSHGRKDMMPKIMMVESLQSETRRSLETPVDTSNHEETHRSLEIPVDTSNRQETRRSLETPVDTSNRQETRVDTSNYHQETRRSLEIPVGNHLTENVFRSHGTDTIQEDQTLFQHAADTRSYLDNNPYAGKGSQREKSPRSTVKHFPEDKPRHGSSGQESIENIGYFLRQEQESRKTSHSSGKATGYGPNHPSGFRTGHQQGFRSSQEGRAGVDQANTSTPRNSERQIAQDSRDVSYKRRSRAKVAVNAFDRRQSRYQGMRYRRSRNFLARRERALDNSQHTVQDHEPVLASDDIQTHRNNRRYNQIKESGWRVRNSMNEADLAMDNFEETGAEINRDFQRKRPISEVYRRPHTTSAAPIIEPPESRQRSASVGEDTGPNMLKMAQEEHNIKMQIHKRKLRILMLEQWSLEQECLQAGYDLPPDYY